MAKRNKYNNDLIRRFVRSDKEAFKEIYFDHYNSLFRYGIVIHRDREVVADIIQDLFVWLWQNPHKLEEINNLQVYLFRSLKRNLLQYLSKRINLRNDFQSSSALGYDLNIEDRIIEKESINHNRKWLVQQLDRLPSKQKEVIFLRYYEGLSYGEIAEILSKSSQVVRNYASRALNQLRNAVDTGSRPDL